jgi:hypothetical protein
VAAYRFSGEDWPRAARPRARRRHHRPGTTDSRGRIWPARDPWRNDGLGILRGAHARTPGRSAAGERNVLPDGNSRKEPLLRDLSRRHLGTGRSDAPGTGSDVPGTVHRAPAPDRSKILIPIPGGGIPIPGGGNTDSWGRGIRFLGEEIPIPGGGNTDSWGRIFGVSPCAVRAIFGVTIDFRLG